MAIRASQASATCVRITDPKLCGTSDFSEIVPRQASDKELCMRDLCFSSVNMTSGVCHKQ